MAYPEFISFGNVGGVWTAIGSKFLRVVGFGHAFTAKYGDLAGKIVVLVGLEQVHKLNGKVVKFDESTFNGIKAYLPVDQYRDSLQQGDILEVSSTTISKAFGTDIYGTATIGHKHLSKVNPEKVEEIKSSKGLEMSAEFKRIFSHNEKVYKYNAIKRYKEDPKLREKHASELADIDNVYKGPGSQFKWKDLEAEFG